MFYQLQEQFEKDEKLLKQACDKAMDDKELALQELEKVKEAEHDWSEKVAAVSFKISPNIKENQ